MSTGFSLSLYKSGFGENEVKKLSIFISGCSGTTGTIATGAINYNGNYDVTPRVNVGTCSNVFFKILILGNNFS